VKTVRRPLCGLGGGGIFDVVAGTGEVVAVGVGAVPVVVPLVVLPDVAPFADAVAVEGAVTAEDEPGCALDPPLDETITATIAPAAARTATIARTRAFFTRPEATLARK
jgi:hypothetical protein